MRNFIHLIVLITALSILSIGCTQHDEFAPPTVGIIDSDNNHFHEMTWVDVANLHNEGMTYINNALCAAGNIDRSQARVIAQDAGRAFVQQRGLRTEVFDEQFTAPTRTAADIMKLIPKLVPGPAQKERVEAVFAAVASSDVRTIHRMWEREQFPRFPQYMAALSIANASMQYQPTWCYRQHLDYRPGEVWAQDAVGGLVGSLFGPEGAFAGALGASAGELVSQMFE